MLPAHRLVELDTRVHKASSSVVLHAKRRYVPGLRPAESILPQRGVLDMSRSILYNHATNEVSRRQVSALCPAVSSPPLNLVARGRSRVGEIRSATIPSDLNASTPSDVMYVDSPRPDNIISFRRVLRYNLAASERHAGDWPSELSARLAHALLAVSCQMSHPKMPHHQHWQA
jgi:hypothetical protein